MNLKIRSLNFVFGYSLLKVLSLFDIQGLSLKYPNDIYFNNKKISGILIYFYKDFDSIHIIVGIGLNINKSFFLPLFVNELSINLFDIIDYKVSKSKISSLIIIHIFFYFYYFAKFNKNLFSNFLNFFEYL